MHCGVANDSVSLLARGHMIRVWVGILTDKLGQPESGAGA